jgi:hypothetical protein
MLGEKPHDRCDDVPSSSPAAPRAQTLAHSHSSPVLVVTSAWGRATVTAQQSILTSAPTFVDCYLLQRDGERPADAH